MSSPHERLKFDIERTNSLEFTRNSKNISFYSSITDQLINDQSKAILARDLDKTQVEDADLDHNQVGVIKMYDGTENSLHIIVDNNDRQNHRRNPLSESVIQNELDHQRLLKL